VDESGKAVSYEILAGDRVVATRNAISVAVPMPASATRYAVRAVDKGGNRSRSTPALVVDPNVL